jgi:hypothetical protein
MQSFHWGIDGGPDSCCKSEQPIDENQGYGVKMGLLPVCIKNKSGEPAWEMMTFVITGVSRWRPLIGPPTWLPGIADRN